MSILQKTDNLVALYSYSVGTSEVPLVLHQWACLAGIAAVVEDRVWVRKHGKPLDPSLWLFLIAPSAIGKGQAVKELLPYMVSAEVNLFFGEVTAQALTKKMSGKPGPDGHSQRAKVFLVNEEAAVCIRYGPAAKDFLVHMTGMYQLPKGVPYQKSALSSGDAKVHSGCINWLLGSTLEWAIDSIPREAIEGGFLGRILPVMVPYDLSLRVAAPSRPDDYDQVRRVILKRFIELRELEGEVSVSKQARAVHKEWYETRSQPKDERLIPTWKRMDDNVWKLAMIYMLAESCELAIKERHMRAAIQATSQLIPAAEKLLAAAAVTPQTQALNFVRDTLIRNTVIKHSLLLKRVCNKGYTRRDMEEALSTLKALGRVLTETYQSETGKGKVGKRYRWLTRHGGTGKDVRRARHDRKVKHDEHERLKKRAQTRQEAGLKLSKEQLALLAEP